MQEEDWLWSSLPFLSVVSLLLLLLSSLFFFNFDTESQSLLTSMRVVTTTLLLGFFLLSSFPFESESLECINSTSYMDRVLVKPRSSECRLKTALCVKTMQISQNTDGSPKVLSIHRECFELEPPQAYREGKGCVDSYDDDAPISRRLGPHLITCFCSQDLCNF
ncbi:hypothetical protein B9Z55_018926 [Caenorhabditis nigoni]|uniref:Uncharacterized protein n=1 Tax=Caenorhabditis nigoni TaxID=1611254 RepID=A0A2G5TH15_9PELO|nr:hypothetical protein B9Z55_018926 [Caenorhabditis nigoni]